MTSEKYMAWFSKTESKQRVKLTHFSTLAKKEDSQWKIPFTCELSAKLCMSISTSCVVFIPQIIHFSGVHYHQSTMAQTDRNGLETIRWDREYRTPFTASYESQQQENPEGAEASNNHILYVLSVSYSILDYSLWWSSTIAVSLFLLFPCSPSCPACR